MRYKLAIFDWNGTLIDDSFANHAAANAELRAMGQSEITIERYRDTMEFPFIHFFNRNGVDTDTYLKNQEMLQETFMSVYEPMQRTAPLRTGAMDVLDSLLDSNVKLMILSNHIQEHLELQMAERHVHAKFHHICGSPNASALAVMKLSKLDRLQKLMKEHGYKPEDAFIIGDSLEEPEIAKTMGMMCVSVTWGCFSKERLHKSPTHHVINDLSELLPLLKSDI